MTSSGETALSREGLRERKRRETARRIAEAGMRLFIDRGYEAATIDEIAAAADISRRTFFHYFTSKDEILLSMQRDMGDALAAAFREELRDKRPLPAMRAASVRICGGYPADDMIVVDRLMRANAAVQARKQAGYIRQEAALFEILRARWPQPERELSLRLAAMACVGALRLAFEALSREGGARPAAVLLNEVFAALEAGI